MPGEVTVEACLCCNRFPRKAFILQSTWLRSTSVLSQNGHGNGWFSGHGNGWFSGPNVTPFKYSVKPHSRHHSRCLSLHKQMAQISPVYSLIFFECVLAFCSFFLSSDHATTYFLIMFDRILLACIPLCFTPGWCSWNKSSRARIVGDRRPLAPT